MWEKLGAWELGTWEWRRLLKLFVCLFVVVEAVDADEMKSWIWGEMKVVYIDEDEVGFS